MEGFFPTVGFGVRDILGGFVSGMVRNTISIWPLLAYFVLNVIWSGRCKVASNSWGV